VADTLISKGERTRHALLTGAIRRFALDGYRATSLADIARDANVTPAAAYAYFANKEALFTEAVDTDAAGLIDEALAPVLGGAFDGDWAGLFRRLIDGVQHHPLAGRLLAGREPEFTGRMLDIPALTGLRTGLAQLLATDQATGAVRPDIDPQRIAMGLEMTVLAMLIATLQTGVTLDGDHIAGVVAVLEAALRAPLP
jgi:AcrR family transcriptional regulator